MSLRRSRTCTGSFRHFWIQRGTEKNRAAWEAALKAGGHRDYTLRILPKANHLLLEANVGNNAEMKSLQRFVPAYFEIVLEWLSKRVEGLGASK